MSTKRLFLLLMMWALALSPLLMQQSMARLSHAAPIAVSSNAHAPSHVGDSEHGRCQDCFTASGHEHNSDAKHASSCSGADCCDTHCSTLVPTVALLPQAQIAHPVLSAPLITPRAATLTLPFRPPRFA